jgi:hypothetical protein
MLVWVSTVKLMCGCRWYISKWVPLVHPLLCGYCWYIEKWVPLVYVSVRVPVVEQLCLSAFCLSLY